MMDSRKGRQPAAGILLQWPIFRFLGSLSHRSGLLLISCPQSLVELATEEAIRGFKYATAPTLGVQKLLSQEIFDTLLP